MFTHLLPSNEKIFPVYFHEYAERHFLKRFRKDYKGKQWQITEDSIRQDLSRISNGVSDLQKTQQIDELWHGDNIWVFKYDFRIAKTNVSAKASGNRVVGVIDNKASQIHIVAVYGKTDLPKNVSETQYIRNILGETFSGIGWQ